MLCQKVGCIWVRSRSPGLLVACSNHPGEFFRLIIPKFYPEMQLHRYFLIVYLNLKHPPNVYSNVNLWHHFENQGCLWEADPGWKRRHLGEDLWRLCCPLWWLPFWDIPIGIACTLSPPCFHCRELPVPLLPAWTATSLAWEPKPYFLMLCLACILVTVMRK